MTRKSTKPRARSRKNAKAILRSAQEPVKPALPKLVSFLATSQPAFQFKLDAENPQVSTFFGDTSEAKAMDKNGIANSRSLSSSSGIVYPLYAVNDPFYQMACGAPSYWKELSEKAIGIAAAGNDLFVLGAAQRDGSLKVSANVWTDISAQNSIARPPANQISTVLYPKQSVENWLQSTGDISVQELPTDASYNLLHEIPASTKQDYSSGRVLANSFLAKSHLDSQYTMNHSSSSSLDNSRQYTGIGSCGDKIFLTYVDNVQIAENGTATSGQPSLGISFPRVEIVGSLRREAGTGKPKRLASLYSIDIHSPIVDAIRETAEKESQMSQYAERIETEMQNGIAKIAESVQPAQLQLFQVKVDGI